MAIIVRGLAAIGQFLLLPLSRMSPALSLMARIFEAIFAKPEHLAHYKTMMRGAYLIHFLDGLTNTYRVSRDISYAMANNYAYPSSALQISGRVEVLSDSLVPTDQDSSNQLTRQLS